MPIEEYFKQMDAPENEELPTYKIFSKIKAKERGKSCIQIPIFSLIYIGLLLTYAFVVDIKAPEKLKHVGFFNSAVIFVTDITLILWKLLSPSKKLFSTPAVGSLVFLISRTLTCIASEYWIVMHSATFFLLLVIFSTVWMWNNVSVKIKANGDNVTIVDDVVQCPNLLKHLQTKEKIDLNFIEAKENAEEIFIRTFKSNFSEFMPTIALSLMFLGYWVLIRDLSMDYEIARGVTFTNTYNQSVFSGFFYALFIGYFLMGIWFRLFKKQHSKVSCKIILFAIAITLIMTAVGAAYTFTVLTSTTSGT